MEDRGRVRPPETFFEVLQETERSQTAVMTIAPGADAGPEEEHGGDQVIDAMEGKAGGRLGDTEHKAGRSAPGPRC